MFSTLLNRTGRAALAAVTALVLLFWAGDAQAQQGAITGQVVDASNLQPVVGAQVFLPGTDYGGLTNEEGRFRITGVPAGEHQVRVRLLGYRTANKMVTVEGGQAVTVDFELAVSAVALEEVTVNVITGERQRRRTQGSNSVNINVSEVNTANTNSFADLLSGRGEGVRLQNVSGGTGTGQRIRIRGANSLSLSNEPLIFVDGTRISAGVEDSDIQIGMGGQEVSQLNFLNPEEIASIEVIKGPAATSLYGSDAANGVILISTKSGQQETRWHFYGQYGQLTDETDYPLNIASYSVAPGTDPQGDLWIRVPGPTPDGQLEIANPAFQKCTNRAAAEGLCSQGVTRQFNTVQDPRTTPFTNGANEKFGGSVSGGSENTTYFASASRLYERNVISYNQQDRTNLRLNTAIQPIEGMSVDMSAGYVDNDLKIGLNNNAVSGPILQGIGGFPDFVPGDGFAGDQPSYLNFGFALPPDELRNRTNLFNTNRFTGSLSGRYNPPELSWLTANLTVGYDLADKSSATDLFSGQVPLFFPDGFRESNRGDEELWTVNTSVQAEYQLTDWLSGRTTVGGSYEDEREVTTTCFGFSPTLGLPSCGATAERFAVDEDFSRIRSVAGFGIQRFAVNERLYVEGSVRADDNSAFGEALGVEYYPGASVSWVMSEEPWFGDSEVLSQLRLRGAWGVSGVRPGFRDAVSLFAPVSVTTPAGSQSATIINVSGNPELEPERVTEWEGGFDASLFEGRLSLQASYYYKESEDALIERQLPPSFGLTADRFANLGSVRNQGIEANLNVEALETEEVGLNLGANLTTIDNEILELGEAVEPITLNRGEQLHKEGFSAGAFHLPQIDFNDSNGDGLLSRDEVTVATDSSTFIDESIPTWEASFNADLRLFDLVQVSTLFDAQGGHSQLNGTESFRCETFLNCPATGDPNAPLDVQAAHVANRFKGTAVGYIESARFLKWRELSVRFSAPEGLGEISPLLADASLTIAGRNLATWTDYTGIDPEVNESGGSSGFNQNEFLTQPPPRTLTARLDFRF